ncbi:carnitinyl-coa dehydratase [Phtheirospermum japonicum]|uniref:Delta(3)-Delta(2)-enoyl-CoA isomerase n=1 Tax=Phtheirospermum japonicum TaxID=374723 RepID=A0A830CWQ8_9LAMI|nr:carnitinyl-coa dehydratase [Phtheirospermum japonicum]
MCTLDKRGDLFILTITGDDEHRLNPTLIDSIRAALSRAKSESESMGGPTALITTAQDPDPVRTQAQARPKAMTKKFRLLVAELISLPMPTIAAVTGHASAGGFMLALSHDYLLMRKDRGFLYMSELDIKYKIPNWLNLLMKNKMGPPKIWRDVVLRAEKITAAVGVEWGIVESAHDTAERTVGAAVRLGMDLVSRKWDGKVYADNRMTVFGDVLAALGSDETVGDNGTNVDEDGNEIKPVSVSRL